MLEESRRLQPQLRAATHEALFGLIAVSGMRRGEAIGLGRDDVDLVDAVLTIREDNIADLDAPLVGAFFWITSSGSRHD